MSWADTGSDPLAEHSKNIYKMCMWEAVKKRVMTFWQSLLRLRLAFSPNRVVWQSWEQSTRAAGLGAIGVSVFASGDQVNPWSLGFGIVLLVLNAYIARHLGHYGKVED